ncbi:MAG TPA: serine protein kinase PrkA [Polyangiaceae bacterium]|jgi:predicted Ser/Thr protein kinase|nr:serine protein kinase PrkA [Polyangiaceae bacterium]
MKGETSEGRPAASQVASIAEQVEARFRGGRRVLSFSEFLSLFDADPVRHSRDASRYLRDVFDHYGKRQVVYPWGEFTRHNLFDLPWDPAQPQAEAHDRSGYVGASGKVTDRPLARGALIGQEQVQEELYRAISNFAREGRPNRLILLHGPNGSAKSTIASCIMGGLENYSSLDEGALYRFHWVFPSQKTIRGALGFGASGERSSSATLSYAHLSDEDIDAKLIVDVRDHPLFLIPVPERQRLLEGAYRRAGATEPPNDWVLRGQLSHKSQQVFEALLSSYKGSYMEVLKHVQVERYFISRRYRVGAVTIGPQLSVDAGERQVTMDRSLQSLPPSLQAVTLYEAKGELVDAAGGVLEFSDLLKRPLDAFKYLQLSIETGEVALTAQNVQLNCVMMGSANELHLDAFREHAEFASFRGRLELARAPYLKSYEQERQIYDTHLVPQVRRHVAPHATEMAALFSVFTRMRKPNPDRYPRPVGAIVSTLTGIEKADLYSQGRAPERLDAESQKLLRAAIKDIWTESDSYPIYEGRIGASPREMRIALLDAAQSPLFKCLNPLAVLEEIDALCLRKNEFEWLQQDAIVGGYHDVKTFRETLMTRLLAAWEYEVYVASGLVQEQQYSELFDHYVQHVSAWVKKENIYNRVTRQSEQPNDKMMAEVERLLDVKAEASEWRQQFIGAIAAWALDHPGARVEPSQVFPQYIKRMREAIFAQRRPAVARIVRDVVLVMREDAGGLDAERKKSAQTLVQGMVDRFGYCNDCATDAAQALLRRRFHELV